MFSDGFVIFKTSKLLSSLIFNAFAHYNLRNRVEYIKLLLRWCKPPEVECVVDEPACIRQTFVLSLKTSLSRRSAIKRIFNNEKLPYTIANGTTRLDIYKFPNAISTRSINYLSEGSIGCWLGHYSIWEKVVNQKIEYSMIFEDDVILANNFNDELKSSLKRVLPDFDILFLNSGNNYSRNKRIIINEQVFIPYQIRNGTYGYIISLDGAIKLLQLIPSIEVTRGGIDSAIGSLIRSNKILAYHLNKPLCWVDFSFKSSTKD